MVNTLLQISPGSPNPLGLSLVGDTSNFSLFSSHATAVTLGLFWDGKREEVPLQRTGDRWHIAIRNIPPHASYAYRCQGPSELLYNPNVWLSDPYAKIPIDPIKTKVALPPSFNWENDNSPRIPSQDLIIYEMHVRGFTKDPSSRVAHPGTYLGFLEKIPYLKTLGVNAVELMPIFEFDEAHGPNYWGYNPTHFFAPTKSYAVADPIYEFKTLVRELHRNQIEVILDVVYNHTGEGKEKDYYVNFRGIDNCVYYMHDAHGNYLNFTGCGNTFNTNHPVVQQLILDSLRYWIEEMHIDGFRFDLASVFTRDPKGTPLSPSPILKAMANDPVIRRAKLIAEAWDAAGLYQLGSFPQWGPWSEWNGRYRDIVRRFIKGTDGKAGFFANVLSGSDMIYRTPLSSINFLTAHDGFTLRDLVSYQSKHNEANGERNHDGTNQNDSWNCGVEGPTQDPKINALRERQMRNFLLTLFLSQGTPMLLMEDAYGHTRLGNNNPYVQDNPISWFLWDKLAENQKMFQFIASLIAFRKTHPQLRRTTFFTKADIDWHSSTPFQPDWSSSSRCVAFTLKGTPSLYAAFNTSDQLLPLTLPPGEWHVIILTSEDWEFHKNGGELVSPVTLSPYSSLLAIEKK